jgi:transposase
MSSFYCGVDLHARNSQLCVIDDHGHRCAEGKVNNDLATILDFLAPYGSDVSIAIESTLNWYWLVDGLMEAGFDVHLAHTLGLFMITGAKVKTDRRDAFKLAKYLRLGELPEAYIYPKEKRSLRDFLRRRSDLVQQRASCYTSLRFQLLRHNLNSFNGQQLKQLLPEDIAQLQMPLESQEYCHMLLARIELLSGQITAMDHYLKAVTVEDPCFQHLLTVPGVRYTLGLTIYYEVGTIERFATPRHFSSYCRLIPGIAQSDKTARRGRGSKQGNHYLKWAFTQAANIAVRYYPQCRKFRDKQANRRVGTATTMVANCILAHKLARATYHVIREETQFHMEKLF